MNEPRSQPGKQTALIVLVLMIVLAGTGRDMADGPPTALQSRDANLTGAEGLIASTEPGWPQWRGPRRDGISDEKGLLTTWPQGGPLRIWKVTGLGRGWSSPILVRDRLFITGDVDKDVVVYAFDLNGNLQWKTTNGEAWTGSYPGARACCAYSEGRLYHMNAHGRVASLDAQNGKELWACDLRERFGTSEITWGLSECLLVDGPRVMVTPGSDKALMAALDARTGQTVWTTRPLGGDKVTHSSPILFRHAGRRILANCSSGHGFGVDADTGELLWTVPLRNAYGTNVAGPVYGEGRIFFVTAYVYGACYHLPSGDGPREPERTWTTSLDTCTGAVLLVDGQLFGSGYQRHKSWLCLDWRTGQTRYEYKGLTTGAAVWADGRLYCQAEDGRVVLLKPADQGFDVAGQFQLVPDDVYDAWAHPVLLDGRLYLRYHDTLWCYGVRTATTDPRR